jgi:drug/metabolite transporter (DMT)-like permease
MPYWPHDLLHNLPVGEAAAVATALLWTMSAVAWTSAGRYIGALSVSFLRLVITCAMLAVYGRLARGLWLPSDATHDTWLLLGISGFFGFFLSDICLFKALLLIGPRVTLLIQSLAPPLTAIMSWLYLGEKLTGRQWLAMGITLAGVVWVVSEQRDDSQQSTRLDHHRSGVLLALFAAAGLAAGLVFAKRGIGQYDAVAATFIRVLGAMAGYLPLVTLVGRWPTMLAAARHARAMMIVTFGALVGPTCGVVMCMIAVRNTHTGVAATIIATMPVLILPFAVFMFHERVSWRALGGALLSLAGVAMLVL